MYNTKKIIFTDLSKNQKSDFLSFVKLYVKNFQECDVESIYYNLLDELEYFRELGQGKFDFIDLSSDQHLSEIKKYIKACKKHFDYKVAMRPVYEEQKRIQKEIRHKILEEKQKKEPPTKKQISYYKSLCKKKGIEPKNIEELSKYDIKMAISSLVEAKELLGDD